jgi:uncharacterized protein YgiM (DUF1202 family)
MNWTITTRQTIGTTILCLAALTTTTAATAATQQMVSVKGSTLNMRSGPGTHTEVLWELKRGYPLKVIARKGRWLQVSDFESDRGWVARSLTGNTPHHVVKSRVANMRSGPGTQHRILGTVEYGEVLRTREKRTDWVKVERDSGKIGWIARRLLWGW